MDENPRPQSATATTAMVILLLLAVGITIGAWHLYQRENGKIDGSGFALSEKPRQTGTPLDSSTEDAPPAENRLDYIVREDAAQDPPALGADVLPRRTRKAASGRDRRIFKSVSFYYDLKNSPRFKDSAFVREWKKDFLSHPDLREINAAFQKDRNAMKFMAAMTRSPNLPELLKKHLTRPEAQAFIKEMNDSPAVRDAAKAFMKDSSIAAMARHLGLAGKSNPESPPEKPAPAPAPKMKLELHPNVQNVLDQK